ncbi:hypothetical protein [Absidia glauca]|uniref:Uncharacterized protein n=1 Tax=Absidia glauca TaxID=4829 RepID=A0A168KS60_ABSGL|nr:hypothetical protein [Absidia glauca]
MRHLFGKEHKEQKSMKLVKKLQLEEDQKWQEELQRRIEQEEKDAAFARELQEQMGSDNNTNASSPPPTSPLTVTPTVLSPPPLPVKPTAYNSPRPASSSSHSNGSSSEQQQRTRPLTTPLLSNSAPSSSSTLSPRETPPPPYQTGQPRLPPRERTTSQVSQVSQYMPSTPRNASITASAPPPPSTSRPSHQHHSGYLPALNTAVTPGIGHQTLNPQPYYPGTPQMQPQQQMYPPPSTTPQPATFQAPRRDPAMLIIPPPRKEKQPTPVSHSESMYASTMSMPEPVRSTTPFHPYPTPAPYSSSFHTATASSSSLVPTTTAVLTPKPAPITQSVTASSSYHSLPPANVMSNATVTRISPKMTSSVPVTSHTHVLQPTETKPDTKSPIRTNMGNRSSSQAAKAPTVGASLFTKSTTLQHDTTKTTRTTTLDPDDSDEYEPLFWERNDGRMMAGTPSLQPKIPDTPANRQQGHHEKHMLTTRDINEDYDSEEGSGTDGDDDDDDQAIDLFNIRANDNVVIHQHNTSAGSPYQSNNTNGKTESHHRHQDDKVSEDHDPFADSFAVSDPKARGSNKSESAPMLGHERSRSAGVIDAKPSFQMNTKSSTIAKVHDPLLMMASKGSTSGATASSSPAPPRPTSTLPWTSAQFSSSVSLATSTPQQSFGPPIGSTIPRPASVYQHPLHIVKNDNEDDDDDLITLDSGDIQQVVPTNVLRAGAPPNIQSMISQMTAEEEIEEAVVKALPKLPKTDPDHRHITVPSVIEDQRVWIRVHPTDTGKSLASRIQIVATYKTRKILSITTDKGRAIALDDTPVFQDWSGVMQMEDGAPWKVEWTVLDHNLWEGPKEFLRYLKASLRS